jgi:type VI secretion system secreted protein Hcp
LPARQYIKGESVDPDFKDWSDVLAWSWGLSNGGNGPAMQDFSWTQYHDSSLVPIFLGVSNGTTFESATFKARKAGKGPVVFFEMAFSDVHLTSLSTGGSGGEDRFTFNASLNYSAVTMTYTPLDSGGRPTTPINGEFKYDLQNNQALTFSGDPNVMAGLFEAGGVVDLAAIPSLVPEPESWAMLLAGLALVGSIGARRKLYQTTRG